MAINHGEFKRFLELPFELRTLIWQATPFPKRLIALVPSSNAWYHQNVGPRRQAGFRFKINSGSDWHFRYSTESRDTSILNLLHTCRESRDCWITRVTPTNSRYKTEINGHRCVVKFDMPYLCYESDIFTVIDPWGADIYSQMAPGPPEPIGFPQSVIDPFIGLDRRLIKHVAVAEIHMVVELAVHILDLHNLPQLETLMILSAGPDVLNGHMRDAQRQNSAGPFPDLEMPFVDIQDIECDLLDIPDSAINTLSFFNNDRLRVVAGIPLAIRPLPK